MEAKLPTVKPGDEILAEHFTAIYDVIRRCQITVGENGGIDMDSGASGVALAAPDGEGLWISLTSRSGNNFAWTEVLHQGGTTWVTGYQSGTTAIDPAHEANANTALPTLPVRVKARREPSSNEVLFSLGAC